MSESVGEMARTLLCRIADEVEAPGASVPVSDVEVVATARQVGEGADALVFAAAYASLPRVEDGETRGAYAGRLRAEAAL